MIGKYYPDVYITGLHRAYVPALCAILPKIITYTHLVWIPEYISARYPLMGAGRIHVRKAPMSAISSCLRAARGVVAEVNRMTSILSA
jgi:hypothetical protein